MADDIAAVTTASEDERRLHELGYAQELRRRMSGFSNFAVSFTIISILSGCLTAYYFGMQLGGPAIIVWGWPFVGIMTLFVGLAMAEVCSSYPTAGGLYYWAAKLAPRNGPAWSWFTGWFNFLGQVAVTAGIDFGASLFINFLFSLWFGFDYTTHWHTIVIYAAVLLLHATMNQFGIRLVALLNNVSVWWHIAGVLIIVILGGLGAWAGLASDRYSSSGNGCLNVTVPSSTGGATLHYCGAAARSFCQASFRSHDQISLRARPQCVLAGLGPSASP